MNANKMTLSLIDVAVMPRPSHREAEAKFTGGTCRDSHAYSKITKTVEIGAKVCELTVQGANKNNLPRILLD